MIHLQFVMKFSLNRPSQQTMQYTKGLAARADLQQPVTVQNQPPPPQVYSLLNFLVHPLVHYSYNYHELQNQGCNLMKMDIYISL